MPELRRDPLLNRWVVIAPERARRPRHFEEVTHTPEPGDIATDPFADGNEQHTTPEIYAIRPDGCALSGPGWTLRVVPNKYPALHVDGDWMEPTGHGLFDRVNAIGAHEVVIETPQPDVQLHQLPVGRIADVVATFRLRMEDLYRDRRIVQVLPFKNHGREAGATLPHSHSQIVGLPFLSTVMRSQLGSVEAYWQEHGRSMFSDIFDAELKSGKRVVAENDHMLALCPYASAMPFEILLLPKQLEPDFRKTTSEMHSALAAMLKTALLKWERVLGPVAYNFMLFSAPGDSSFIRVRDEFPQLDSYYQWHVQMFPRLSRLAGFEFGTGSHINMVVPEEAATALRAAKVTL